MQTKILQMKRALRTALLVLLLSVVGIGKFMAQSFTVDDLNYSVNDDGVSVKVTGHAYGTWAYGTLNIPETVTYNSNSYTVTAIADSAFLRCYNLFGDLLIPNSVTSIGKHAFEDCYGFTGNLTIPNSVTTIGKSAFFDCSGFTNLTLPNSVTSIADSTFAFCNFTGSLVIPNSVTTIGDWAFYACEFTSLSIGNSVTSIGDFAFCDCWQLSGDLIIPNSVVTIGEGAFESCSGFTGNLIIGNSVTTIDDWAFYDCFGFTSLTIGNSVTTIGEGAFYWCEGFTGNLTIPNSVTTIGEEAFGSCSGFTSSLTIPNSVTSIGDGAFYDCSGFTSLTIGNSVTSIGGSAFGGCTGLTSIFIPSSVTALEGNAFWYCNGIEQITVASENPVYDSRNNCNAIIETASNILVTGCVNTVVPNTVTIIGYEAFGGCGLTSVVLPASVTTLEDFAYSMCDNLTVVDIPNHVVSIGKGVFASCYGIEQITVEEGNPVYDSRGNCNAIIEASSNILIQGCKSTVIPNSVVKIGDYSFRGCSLTSIEMPDSVLEIGDWAFCGSGLSGKLKIGDSVTVIGDLSFDFCENLTSIEFGNSVTRIGKQAFSECYNLSGDLIIPNSVTVIDKYAFMHYDDVFGGTLILGNSLDSIGSCAFKGCQFDTVVSLNPTPPIGYYSECYPCPSLIVCCGSKEAYETSDWAYYFSTIEEDCGMHNVIIDEANMSGGNVSASVSMANLGDEVRLTITPDEGMKMSSLLVSNANNPSQTFPAYPISNSSVYGFTMPPFDVVVTAIFTVNNSTSENNNVMFLVYPNPTNGQIKIEAEDLKHITINNLLGQTIFDGNASGNTFEYDFSKHKTGIYLIRIETASGVAVERVSVTR